MRSSRSRVLTAILATTFLLALLPLTGQAGDQEVAKLLFRKAKKAYREKTYQEAADLYRRVLEEHTPYPEAALGLAESLEKLGKSDEALLAYIACKDQAAALGKLSSTQKRALSSATKAIGRIGKGYGELEKAEQELVKDCLAFGKRHASKEPGWAKRAYQIVLAVDPTNSTAAKASKKLKEVRAVAFGTPEQLFENDSMPGWEFSEHAARWTTSEGVTRGDFKDRPVSAWMMRKYYRGKLRVRWQMRLVESDSTDWQFGLILGEPRAPQVGYGILLGTNFHLQLSRLTPQGIEVPKNVLLEPFNGREWHTYELDSRPDVLTVSVDGVKIFSHVPAAGAPARGNFGLHVSRAVAEFKDLEVIR